MPYCTSLQDFDAVRTLLLQLQDWSSKRTHMNLTMFLFVSDQAKQFWRYVARQILTGILG